MLFNWVKSHKYLILLLIFTTVLAYGIAVKPYDQALISYVGAGTLGCVLFGILTLVREKQRVIGGIGIAVGSAIIAIALFIIVAAIYIFLHVGLG
jgi:hypothetical protein